MILKEILYYVFVIPVLFMKNLVFPMGEYNVTVWQLFLYSFIAFISVKLVFGLIGGGGGGDGD